MREYIDEVTEDEIYTYLQCKTFSIDFLREFRDKINWIAVFSNQVFDEKEIDEFKEQPELWRNFLSFQFTQTVFEKYKDYLGYYD